MYFKEIEKFHIRTETTIRPHNLVTRRYKANFNNKVSFTLIAKFYY